MFYTCGSNTFGALCEGNQTLSGTSSNSLEFIAYESGACDTVRNKLVETFPNKCIPTETDDDDGDDDNFNPYGQYTSVEVVGYSSSSDDTYGVGKGAYVALIIMIFVALGIGAAIAYGALKSGASSNSGLNERLTQAKANSDNI